MKRSCLDVVDLIFSGCFCWKLITTCAEKDGSNPRRRKGKKQHGESFMIASASESSQAVAGIPAWRVALGNIAAGATAGATVEAGECRQKSPICAPS